MNTLYNDIHDINCKKHIHIHVDPSHPTLYNLHIRTFTSPSLHTFVHTFVHPPPLPPSPGLVINCAHCILLHIVFAGLGRIPRWRRQKTSDGRGCHKSRSRPVDSGVLLYAWPAAQRAWRLDVSDKHPIWLRGCTEISAYPQEDGQQFFIARPISFFSAHRVPHSWVQVTRAPTRTVNCGVCPAKRGARLQLGKERTISLRCQWRNS